uniref:Uncharacterized protein n=1 Tax=Siphoviridae sp. cttDR14 TaxID=2826490 RepID=A0A8S5M237_9CAUD|nr:MAG TPA: hypothetical protein [Siphoviridae sp. cttDR14]
MALFGKKLSAIEELKRAYEKLSDEEKEAFKKSLTPEETTEETKTEEEVKEETKPGEEATEEVEQAATEENSETKNAETTEATDEESSEVETTEEQKEEVPAPTEVTEEISDEQADNRDEVIQGLTDRVNALEEALKGFEELKALMEEYNAKNAERFGYKGKSDTEKKSFQDMTTEELAERQKIKI